MLTEPATRLWRNREAVLGPRAASVLDIAGGPIWKLTVPEGTVCAGRRLLARQQSRARQPPARSWPAPILPRGGLLRDRAGRLDVSAAHVTLAAVLSGVEALINPMPIQDAAS